MTTYLYVCRHGLTEHWCGEHDEHRASAEEEWR